MQATEPVAALTSREERFDLGHVAPHLWQLDPLVSDEMGLNDFFQPPEADQFESDDVLTPAVGRPGENVFDPPMTVSKQPLTADWPGSLPHSRAGNNARMQYHLLSASGDELSLLGVNLLIHDLQNRSEEADVGMVQGVFPKGV